MDRAPILENKSRPWDFFYDFLSNRVYSKESAPQLEDENLGWEFFYSILSNQRRGRTAALAGERGSYERNLYSNVIARAENGYSRAPGNPEGKTSVNNSLLQIHEEKLCKAEVIEKPPRASGVEVDAGRNAELFASYVPKDERERLRELASEFEDKV